MRARPLKPLWPATTPAPFHRATLPIHLERDFKLYLPSQHNMNCQRAGNALSARPKAWIASLINKIIIRVVIPLNRSFCKYLNPINKVFSEGVQQTLPFRELTCCDSTSLFLAPSVARVILINTTPSLNLPLKENWDSVFFCMLWENKDSL